MPLAMADEPRDAQDSGEQEPRLGTIISDRYKLDALVGSGSMGRVFAGEHVLLRKRVAIKVLHREIGEISEYAQRFEREAMAAANIGNEHIVAATDCGRLTNGSLFLVLDYVQGRNLREEMADGAFGAERALHIAGQIADALESAHQLGIVHRDLKPENVMLVDKGGDHDFVRVMDFGIAKVPLGESSDGSKALTRVGVVFGTPEYMAPEQALAGKVDARTDLYALGVMLYEMLTGLLPFASEGEACLRDKIVHRAPPFAERAPGVRVNPDIEQLVQKLLHRNLNARVATAGELRRAIDGLLGTATEIRAAPAAETPAATSPARSFLGLPVPALAALGAVLILVVAVVIAVASRNDTGASAAATPSASSSAVATNDAVGRASKEGVATATGKGMEALLELQHRYPKDAKIAMARCGAHLREKNFVSAVSALSEALTLEPALKQDAQVASVLWVAAQNRKSADAAFALLSGPMGTRGRDIMRDLMTTAGVRSDVKTRAKEALARSEGFVP